MIALQPAQNEITIREDGQATISQRKAAELLGVQRNSIVHFCAEKFDISQGVSEEVFAVLVQHFAFDARKKTKQAQQLAKQIMKAGVRAYLYHLAGYRMSAEKSTDDPVIRAAQVAKAMAEAAKAFGFRGNQATLSANQAVYHFTGINLLEAMGQTHLPAPDNEQIFTPTQIGAMLTPKQSARSVNTILAAMGYQEKHAYKAGKTVWKVTEKGEPFAAILDTGKKHSNGSPVQQIKWKKSVVTKIQSKL